LLAPRAKSCAESAAQKKGNDWQTPCLQILSLLMEIVTQLLIGCCSVISRSSALLAVVYFLIGIRNLLSGFSIIYQSPCRLFLDKGLREGSL
jgi:hypothetical protein